MRVCWGLLSASLLTNNQLDGITQGGLVDTLAPSAEYMRVCWRLLSMSLSTNTSSDGTARDCGVKLCTNKHSFIWKCPRLWCPTMHAKKQTRQLKILEAQEHEHPRLGAHLPEAPRKRLEQTRPRISTEGRV